MPAAILDYSMEQDGGRGLGAPCSIFTSMAPTKTQSIIGYNKNHNDVRPVLDLGYRKGEKAAVLDDDI